MFGAYPKINFMACKSHALKHRDDFFCATAGILEYALEESSCLNPFRGFQASMLAITGEPMPRA
jgi:hypothetical protein